MCVDGGGEAPEIQGISRETYLRWRAIGRQRQARPRVFSLKQKALKQYLVSLRIRSTAEYRIDGEVWLRIGHWEVDTAAVLEKKEVPNERRGMVAEPAFTVGGPDVFSVTDRFFGAVVEVIAETRSDLRFELDGKQELTAYDNEQVPFLF